MKIQFRLSRDQLIRITKERECYATVCLTIPRQNIIIAAKDTWFLGKRSELGRRLISIDFHLVSPY